MPIITVPVIASIAGRLRHNRLSRDTRGAILIEAAIAMPVLITLLLGVITYGGWFMTAHSLQEAANDAARASLAGLDADERRKIVDSVVQKGLANSGTLDSSLVKVSTGLDGDWYSVTLSYDITKSAFYKQSLVPLPSGPIERSTTVQLPQV